MKQRFLIFFGLILLVALLVALNAASYTQKEKTPDSEASPNRSSYNSGATGTQAWFSLLAETGHKAVHWQEPPSSLTTARNRPSAFVVVGTVRREFDDAEVQQLLTWVSGGGSLVIVDRDPPIGLVTTTANWQVKVEGGQWFGLLSADPSDQQQMTHETPAVKPSQPSLLTHSINAIQPSQFTGAISFEKFEEQPATTPAKSATPAYQDYYGEARKTDPEYDDEDEYEEAPLPTKKSSGSAPTVPISSSSQIAPVAYFVSGNRNILVEAPFGEGKIIYLSDPYIVSNAGIGLVDNAQLAVNLVAGKDAVIAFDEYHQGFGGDNNAFLKFFEGTPVVAIFFQALLLVGLVFFSQSRRFARPVPEPEPDRLSKLEYVSAMAELQQRVRAYDLAIENIYTDFRRRASRLLGADNFLAKYEELARLIAERTGLEYRGVADTLFKCEDIIRGEPTSKREVVALIGGIRQLEQKLGLARAAKQKLR
jgi:hypothetical protein